MPNPLDHVNGFTSVTSQQQQQQQQQTLRTFVYPEEDRMSPTRLPPLDCEWERYSLEQKRLQKCVRACVQSENSAPLSEMLWELIISQPTGIVVGFFFLILAFTDEMRNLPNLLLWFGLCYSTNRVRKVPITQEPIFDNNTSYTCSEDNRRDTAARERCYGWTDSSRLN